MTPSSQPQRSRIIVAFALLYVLWGSTYLAMRVIVRDMPPYVAGAVRYLIAGPIMLDAGVNGPQGQPQLPGSASPAGDLNSPAFHRQHWRLVGRRIRLQRPGLPDRGPG